MSRFSDELTEVDMLRRELEAQASDLIAGITLCEMTCGSCELLCIMGRRHDGPHDCKTSHRCENYRCEFDEKPCGAP